METKISLAVVVLCSVAVGFGIGHWFYEPSTVTAAIWAAIAGNAIAAAMNIFNILQERQ